MTWERRRDRLGGEVPEPMGKKTSVGLAVYRSFRNVHGSEGVKRATYVKEALELRSKKRQRSWSRATGSPLTNMRTRRESGILA
jgi:hypothetical protein